MDNILKSLKNNLEKTINKLPNIPEKIFYYKNIDKLIKYIGEIYTEKGSTGNIREVLNNNNLIAKIMEPCKKDNHSISHKNMCHQLKNKKYYKIVNGNKDKYLLLLPSLISEVLINKLLSELVETSFATGFSNIYGSILENNSTISIYKKYDDDYSKYIKTKNDCFNFFIQITHSLYVAQNMLKFTHYDLHLENIVFEKCDYEYIVYNFDKIYIKIKNNGWLLKIIDFGMSSIQHKNYKIKPNIINSLLNYSHFSPSYDFMFLFGMIYLNSTKKYRENFNKNVIKLFNKLDYKDILTYFISNNNYNNSIKNIYNNENLPHRLDISYLYENIDKIKSIKSMFKYFIINYKKEFPNDVEYMETIKKEKNYLILKESLNIFKDEKYMIKGLSEKIIKKDYLYSIINKNIYINSYYFITGSNFNNLNNDKCFLDQIYHELNIDSLDNYKISSKCCDINMYEILEKKDNYGVCINGTFFDIKNTRMPIGYYKDNNLKSDLKIPENYVKYYGVVSFDNNKIYIDKIDNLNKYKNNEYVFISGPLLIYNKKKMINKVILDEQVLYKPTKNNEYTNPKLWKCYPFNNNNKIDLYEGYTYYGYKTNEKEKCIKKYINNEVVYNCDKINPGELSHSANLNPRTIMLIKEDGSLSFIVVEGRDNRGKGMDLYHLTELAYNKGAIHAINLDGGQSSNIVWKKEDTPNIIYTINENKLSPYITGNVITILKK